MVIAINMRFLIRDKLEGYGYFALEVFRRMVRNHPQHQFYFIFDREYDPAYLESANVKGLVASPPARHPVLWKYWYDYKIPGILKKIKADLFVSPDGYCSLRTKVPQCMVVHDLGFLHFSQAYKSSHLFYLKWYTPKFLRKADAVATVSLFSRDDILSHYKIDPHKITVVYSAVKEGFKPLPFEEQEKLRNKYANGNSYFIYAGAIQPRKNLINLLKAFSIFKKRQKSSMKLVLAGRMAWKNNAFLDMLKTYKYKDDVVLTGYIDETELAALIASSYALVYPSFFEGFGVPVLEAMTCGVPALTSRQSSMEEIGEDAALYFDPSDHTDIAESMMLIYKDEKLRNNLIHKGLARSGEYSWQKTSELLWSAMEKAISLPSPHKLKT